MNKEQMELKKPYVMEWLKVLKKGLESVAVGRPQMEVKDAYFLITSAKELKRFCEKMSCCDCIFMNVASRGCNINQPEDWEI